MRLPTEPEPSPQINIVPMIDVIFAILTFFIMSTLFLTYSEGLPVTLPGAVTSEMQRQEQMVVTIDGEGNLFLNRQPMDLSGLTEQVRSQIESGKTPLVVINADTNVNHGTVVAVMDQLRTIAGVRMAIATQQP
jgi:biopolymer transport protein ExbD